MIRSRLFPITVVALAAGACDAQATDEYRGEPLAVISGTVVNNSSAGAGDLEVVVVWVNEAAIPEVFAAERTPVQSEFPSGYEVAVYATPPPEAMLPWYLDEPENGAMFAVAYILASPGWLIDAAEQPDGGGDGAEEYDGPFGGAENHVLIYVDRDTLYDETQVRAGFHIFDVIDVDDPLCLDDTFDCMVPSERDLETQVPIRIEDGDGYELPGIT